jgi:DNA polymerase-3 subunit chi
VTRISFFHGASDRLQAAADWLARGREPRQRVVVYIPATDDMERMDRLLWTASPTGFTPHCRSDSPLAAETPIVLAAAIDATQHDECLVNLSHEIPPGFARFEHLVEVVSTADSDRIPGRERFRFYRERGYALEARDLAGGPA